MHRNTKRNWIIGGMVCLGGCAHPSAPREAYSKPDRVANTANSTTANLASIAAEQTDQSRLASFRRSIAEPTPKSKLLRSLNFSIDGKDTVDRWPRATIQPPQDLSQTVALSGNTDALVERLPPPVTAEVASMPTSELYEMFGADQQPNVVDLDLASALSMVGGQNPVVGFARWRVQEAYAQLDQARILWLPDIQTGFSFHRHDGNYQASNGAIVDINRNSFQYGLGNGAVGAGTTPRPGVVAEYHLADAIFQPKIAEKSAWATQHAASGVNNRQLLDAAVAYLQLLDAHQDHRIVQQTRDRTTELAKLTADFAATGRGLQADADRMQTERMLVESRLVAARERMEVTSARLTQVLSLAHGQRIVPREPTVVPIDLVSVDTNLASLISTGLAGRPELKESQALVAAACHEYQRQKYAPFVPSVLLGLSTGGFGGGLGNELDNVDQRYDLDAAFTWQARNFGLGELAARRESSSRVQLARFEAARVMDQVAREISESHSQVLHRAERIRISEQAIETAQNSYDRNRSRIRDGQGLPLEVLQSVRALEEAQRAYLSAVIDYNQAQFRLQWSLGWPVAIDSNR